MSLRSGRLGAPPTATADRARAIYVAACAGLLFFSAGFVLTATTRGLSLPWYEPLQRRWHVASVAPTGVAMDYFGRLLVATIASVAGAGIGFLAGRRRALHPALLRACFVWALAMTVLGLFLYAWALAHRVIVTG